MATRLAQGGTGSIYVCRRANGQQPQALFTMKVIRQHALQKEAAVFSFKREARVGALLHHLNAQTVVDSGTYDEQPFLILPYIEGGNLTALLVGEARPSPSAVVTVLLDVLRALQHAHCLTDEQGKRLGLVHGDVSPENILVGTDGVARLTDFGSARFTAEGAGGQADAFGLGKPSYMSPEQLRGEALDVRSDIFAVGVVMWTALTGQKLFAAETYDQTVMRVMRRKIPPPSSLGAPEALDDVCLQALSRSPEGRFASADEMADALMTAAAKADLVASRERVAQWVRRDLGETLAERRRRIELMFGDDAKTPAPVAHSAGARSRPATTPITGVTPAITVQMTSMGNAIGDSMGATKSALTRTIFIPRQGPVRPNKLSRKQWYVITSVSVATFFLTLIVGTWLSRLTTPRRGGPSSGQTASITRSVTGGPSAAANAAQPIE